MSPPDDCPDCGQVLYHVAKLRPTPSFTTAAKLLFLLGTMMTAAVYWAGLI